MTKEDFFVKYDIPTAGYKSFIDFESSLKYLDEIDYPTVVKADGLAAGKGVSVCTSEEEALKNAKEILEVAMKNRNDIKLAETNLEIAIKEAKDIASVKNEIFFRVHFIGMILHRLAYELLTSRQMCGSPTD